MTSKKLAALAVLVCSVLSARNLGGRAEYVGGTVTQIPFGCRGRVQALDDRFLVFYAGKASWRVPYDKINLVEYGQKVDRRYFAAVLISPLFLLAKKRQHFLTVGYSDEENRQQALIFKSTRTTSGPCWWSWKRAPAARWNSRTTMRARAVKVGMPCLLYRRLVVCALRGPDSPKMKPPSNWARSAGSISTS